MKNKLKKKYIIFNDVLIKYKISKKNNNNNKIKKRYVLY